MPERHDETSAGRQSYPAPRLGATSFQIAVTGHRPDKLGGYGPSQTQTAVRAAIRAVLDAARNQVGPRLVVLSGMALGVDQWWAEEATALGIPFAAIVPFDGQEERWPSVAQASYRRLLAQAIIVQTLRPRPETDREAIAALYARNQALVDRCHAAVAVWDGTPSGTADAVRRFTAAARPLLRIRPGRDVDPEALRRWSGAWPHAVSKKGVSW